MRALSGMSTPMRSEVKEGKAERREGTEVREGWDRKGWLKKVMKGDKKGGDREEKEKREGVSQDNFRLYCHILHAV